MDSISSFIQVRTGIQEQRFVATCNHQKMELPNRADVVMPKMKTKSSAKKRFRVRPGGTVKRGQAFKRHILTKKSTKNKRHLRGAVGVHETNMDSVRAMMPFA
ncbi:MAG: ribosomal subunit protein [Pseudomonadota bacterium]